MLLIMFIMIYDKQSLRLYITMININVSYKIQSDLARHMSCRGLVIEISTSIQEVMDLIRIWN